MSEMLVTFFKMDWDGDVVIHTIVIIRKEDLKYALVLLSNNSVV